MSEQTPRPSFEKTYRRADGEEIGDFGWVTDTEGFECDEGEPVEYVEETWERTSVRSFWQLPITLYSCTKADDCDEDAVKWEQQPDGEWVQTCAEHAEIVEAARG